ncbi:MAG TPA: hypothetical protein VJB16_02360, partial [archaeon]|nr:hypothetical protein [archaeon]
FLMGRATRTTDDLFDALWPLLALAAAAPILYGLSALFSDTAWWWLAATAPVVWFVNQPVDTLGDWGQDLDPEARKLWERHLALLEPERKLMARPEPAGAASDGQVTIPEYPWVQGVRKPRDVRYANLGKAFRRQVRTLGSEQKDFVNVLEQVARLGQEDGSADLRGIEAWALRGKPTGRQQAGKALEQDRIKDARRLLLGRLQDLLELRQSVRKRAGGLLTLHGQRAQWIADARRLAGGVPSDLQDQADRVRALQALAGRVPALYEVAPRNIRKAIERLAAVAPVVEQLTAEDIALARALTIEETFNRAAHKTRQFRQWAGFGKDAIDQLIRTLSPSPLQPLQSPAQRKEQAEQAIGDASRAVLTASVAAAPKARRIALDRLAEIRGLIESIDTDRYDEVLPAAPADDPARFSSLRSAEEAIRNALRQVRRQLVPLWADPVPGTDSKSAERGSGPIAHLERWEPSEKAGLETLGFRETPGGLFIDDGLPARGGGSGQRLKGKGAPTPQEMPDIFGGLTFSDWVESRKRMWNEVIGHAALLFDNLHAL